MKKSGIKVGNWVQSAICRGMLGQGKYSVSQKITDILAVTWANIFWFEQFWAHILLTDYAIRRYFPTSPKQCFCATLRSRQTQKLHVFTSCHGRTVEYGRCWAFLGWTLGNLTINQWVKLICVTCYWLHYIVLRLYTLWRKKIANGDCQSNELSWLKTPPHLEHVTTLPSGVSCTIFSQWQMAGGPAFLRHPVDIQFNTGYSELDQNKVSP